MADNQPKVVRPRELTRKQKAFVQHLLDNPKASPTKAALETYGQPGKPTTYKTAEQIAFDNLRKPSVIMALAEHSKLFESAIVGTVRDWKDSPKAREREIALDAAKYGHDKVYGKATQQIEQTTRSVSITIDLTAGEAAGDVFEGQGV